MKNSVTDIRAILTTTPDRWRSLAQTLPAELLRRPPAPGEWSAVECLQHMIDTERVFHSRLQAFLRGEDFPAFDPDSEGTKPNEQQNPAALAAEFGRLRAEGLQQIDRIGEGDRARQVRHAELGPVTLDQMLHEWAAHDLSHTVQAEEAIMQPFIRGCGPWQKYFTAHVADAAS